MADIDTCACCGEYVPEGTMVCQNCLEKSNERLKQGSNRKNTKMGNCQKYELVRRFRKRRKF